MRVTAAACECCDELFPSFCSVPGDRRHRRLRCAAPESQVAEASAPPPPAAVNAPYRLAAGDRLRVIVFGQDNLSNSFSVDSSGVISMPLAGRLRAQGLSTAELERAIEARLRRGYLREPSVSVEVEAFRPIFILGGVEVAGQYAFVDGMTVNQAVAAAGGFARARSRPRSRSPASSTAAPKLSRRRSPIRSGRATPSTSRSDIFRLTRHRIRQGNRNPEAPGDAIGRRRPRPSRWLRFARAPRPQANVIVSPCWKRPA